MQVEFATYGYMRVNATRTKFNMKASTGSRGGAAAAPAGHCRPPQAPLGAGRKPPQAWHLLGGGGVMRSSSLGSTPKAASVECNYNLLKSNPLLRFPQFVESINGTILDDFTLTKPVNWTAPTAAARETQRTEVRRGRLLLPLCARRHRGAASPHGCVCVGGGAAPASRPLLSTWRFAAALRPTPTHPPARLPAHLPMCAS